MMDNLKAYFRSFPAFVWILLGLLAASTAWAVYSEHQVVLGVAVGLFIALFVVLHAAPRKLEANGLPDNWANPQKPTR